MNELFTEIPESKPTRLQAARIAHDKAAAEYERAEKLLDEQGPEAKPVFDAARTELVHAEYELREAELEAL
jgi:hypothetical protein